MMKTLVSTYYVSHNVDGDDLTVSWIEQVVGSTRQLAYALANNVEGDIFTTHVSIVTHSCIIPSWYHQYNHRINPINSTSQRSEKLERSEPRAVVVAAVLLVVAAGVVPVAADLDVTTANTLSMITDSIQNTDIIHTCNVRGDALAYVTSKRNFFPRSSRRDTDEFCARIFSAKTYAICFHNNLFRATWAASTDLCWDSYWSDFLFASSQLAWKSSWQSIGLTNTSSSINLSIVID